MRYVKLSLLLLLTLCYFITASAQSIEGIWTTIDDKTGQKRSLVKLTLTDTLSGTIVKIFPKEGDTGICSRCHGEFKDKKIAGLKFIWGLKDKGNGVWDDGKIIDPKKGKIYNLKMTLKDDKLYVRGYAGVSLLGRTQVWIR